MQPSLRVARVDVSRYRLVPSAFDQLDELHRQLQRVIRHHLSADTASVLCLPVTAADGVTVDWYTDLSGQPVQLTALPPERRAAAKRKLDDRLNALRRLAEQLPARVRGSEAIAAALETATHYPDDSHVYVVGNEPVLTLWGFVLANPGARHGKVGSPEEVAACKRRRLVGVVVSIGILLLAAAGIAAWLWWLDAVHRSLQAELELAVASRCEDPDLLPALSHRLNQIDPEQADYADIRNGLKRAQRQCEVEASRSRALAEARWNCSALVSLEMDWGSKRAGRSATGTPEQELERRRKVCTRAEDLDQRLQSGRGNCGTIAELETLLAGTAPEEKPITDLRPDLDKELSRCRAADELRSAMDDAGQDCDKLKQVDTRLSREDATRSPLLALREALDGELAICSATDELERKRIQAQGDCKALREISQGLAEKAAADTRFDPVRQQLEADLAICTDMENSK